MAGKNRFTMCRYLSILNAVPSVFTLEGPVLHSGLGKQAQKQAQVQLMGENLGLPALVDWMHKQNVFVAGAVALGLSLIVGYTVSTAFIWGFEKVRR